MSEKHIYPEKKWRELKDTEKARIRDLAEKKKLDTYQIAKKLDCSNSQVAGIKAHLKQ
jgi:hypothetical protein